MKRLSANKWSVLALGLLVGSLLLSRGGLAMLGSLWRLILPVLVVYLVFKWGKKKFITAAQEALRKQMESQGMGWPGGQGGGPFSAPNQSRTIDLCSKCGSYLAPGHRCRL
jgi:hypothetical protein